MDVYHSDVWWAGTLSLKVASASRATPSNYEVACKGYDEAVQIKGLSGEAKNGFIRPSCKWDGSKWSDLPKQKAVALKATPVKSTPARKALKPRSKPLRTKAASQAKSSAPKGRKRKAAEAVDAVEEVAEAPGAAVEAPEAAATEE